MPEDAKEPLTRDNRVQTQDNHAPRRANLTENLPSPSLNLGRQWCRGWDGGGDAERVTLSDTRGITWKVPR